MRTLTNAARITAAACLMFTLTTTALAQERILLWPDGQAPQFKPDARETETHPRQPTLDIYKPDWRPSTTAVIVCPGGGYGNLAMNHEGKEVGDWFAARGVTAFVLRYRHAPDYQHPVPMMDVQRAIRHVRANAAEYRINPETIGVLGFSAGGHLASTAATLFDSGNPDAADPIDRVSSRPDFAVLCYPVISISTQYGHSGSKRNLLGNNPDPALVEKLSTEKQITANTPPIFIFQTDEDNAVPAENAVFFYLAARQAGVEAEMHIFQPGRHGVGFAPGDARLGDWPPLLAAWMQQHGWLERD